MLRDIPEHHARLLNQMLGLPELAEQPAKVVDAYWELKRCGDPIDCGTTDTDLKWLLYHLGYGKRVAKVAGPTVVELWKKKKIKAYDPVLVQWRDEEIEARIVRVKTNGEVLIELPEGAEHSVTPDKVRVPELVEA